MPGKKQECEGCQRVMRSDNLRKHEKICNRFLKKYSSPHSSYDQDLPQNRSNISKPMTNPSDSIPTSSKTSKLSMNDSEIPVFDGAEFCGDKPLSDDTLLRMMENLGVPPDRRARNLELFRKDQESDKKVHEKMKNSSNFIDTLDSKQDDCCPPIRQVKSLKAYKDLSEEEKILVEKFNQLLGDMQTGNDNGEELCVILNKLRNTEILDEESSQRLFNVMGDIYNESVL